jgi:hypothetical protein
MRRPPAPALPIARADEQSTSSGPAASRNHNLEVDR